LSSTDEQAYVLILEDDPDQMDLFVGLVMNELRQLIDADDTPDDIKSRFKRVGILKLNNIESLKRAAKEYQGVVLMIMDCNVPARRGKPPEDQFIKEKHRITGQHRSVDIALKDFRGAPIILTSSMDRFKTMVTQYYRNQADLNLRFFRKSDIEGIQKALRKRLLSAFKSN